MRYASNTENFREPIALHSAFKTSYGSLAAQIFSLFMVLFVFCSVASAQSTTGQFNGHVVDQSGAIVPGATVTLLDVQTGLARTSTTNSAGLYTFPLVAPGEYKLSVAKTGFSTEVSPPFRLDVNQNVTQDFTLKVDLDKGIPAAAFLASDGSSIGNTNNGELEPSRNYHSEMILHFLHAVVENHKIVKPQ